jgi:hypothetical protein
MYVRQLFMRFIIIVAIENYLSSVMVSVSEKGNDSLVSQLQEVMSQQYAEQALHVEEKYYRLKPLAFSETGGLSHYSCLS